MKAMVLKEIQKPLELCDVPLPQAKENEVLVKVLCCGVCRTDLHIVDGDLKEAKLPLIPGHQIVGTIETQNATYPVGQLVGIPWLGKSCGTCPYCRAEKENLCDYATYTGYHKDGGYAEYCTADIDFLFPIPSTYSPLQAAPLLCAGLIGYRALRMTEGAQNIGFYGFGSAAHILTQVINDQGGKVFAFIREGNEERKKFAQKMGAYWVGWTHDPPPELLDAALLFAPVGDHYPIALKAVKKGGLVVSAGIHMSDIPSFSYDLLWGERKMMSVSNLTRRDGVEFLQLAPKIPIVTETTIYPLEEANRALNDIRSGKLKGSAVLNISL